MERLRATLKTIVSGLVDSPEAVIVECEDLGTVIVFHVSVAESDVKRVLGKDGRTARSLSMLVDAVGTRAGRVTKLDVSGNLAQSRQGAQ